MVNLLLKAHADVELKDSDGDTALHYSAFGYVCVLHLRSCLRPSHATCEPATKCNKIIYHFHNCSYFFNSFVYDQQISVDNNFWGTVCLFSLSVYCVRTSKTHYLSTLLCILVPCVFVCVLPYRMRTYVDFTLATRPRMVKLNNRKFWFLNLSYISYHWMICIKLVTHGGNSAIHLNSNEFFLPVW